MFHKSKELPRARGYFESLRFADGRLIVGGWIALPGVSMTRAALVLNGVVVATVSLTERADVAATIGGTGIGRSTGFYFECPIDRDAIEQFVEIEVVGSAHDWPCGRLWTLFCRGYFEGMEFAPESLRKRVTNLTSLEAYVCSALQSFSDFTSAAMRHVDVQSIRRVLDWGCGCGRLTSLFLKYGRFEKVCGCDIDAEAVDWCRAHIPGAEFSAIAPVPPTDYPTESFDFIWGYSIFTHLSADLQTAWLAELRRVLRPEGLLLVSVHGEFAARFAQSPAVDRALRERGIADFLLDQNLDGIAPENYYRSVYQTRAWTTEHWSKFIPVIDYIDRGMGHYQDLVVLRKA